MPISVPGLSVGTIDDAPSAGAPFGSAHNAPQPLLLASQPCLPRKRPRLGGKFLVFSSLAHVLFLIGAAFLAVQNPVARKKMAIAPARRSNASEHSLQHSIQLKKQRAGGAPPSARRVTAYNSHSKVSLPAMPALPTLSLAPAPTSWSAMGAGTGLGFGAGRGNVNFFGAREGIGLIGHLYDFKQDWAGQRTGVGDDQYAVILKDFVRRSFDLATLARFRQGTAQLRATTMFTPSIDANEAPKAFGVAGEVQPRLWAAVYRGRVVPTESGVYRFVGFGDDVLVVKFNGRVVLDHGYLNPSGLRASRLYYYGFDSGSWYDSPVHTGGHGEGLPFEVVAGKAYDLQILIGEQPGGVCMYQLMIQKDGAVYELDAAGNPILPPFQIGSDPLPLASMAFPPFARSGPLWRAKATGQNTDDPAGH